MFGFVRRMYQRGRVFDRLTEIAAERDAAERRGDHAAVRRLFSEDRRLNEMLGAINRPTPKPVRTVVAWPGRLEIGLPSH